MNNVMNIVNFVRGCEPRDPNMDLYTPVAEEIKINKEYGFKSTFLLQYDAMIRKDFQELFLKERNEELELGIWFEMGRPFNEAVGIEWRGREGYDWDWHVNSGFLQGYTVEERKKLIDEAFRLFKEIFGEYPKVAGSWLLDAFSMQYMSEKYGMDAFVICREQHSIDAYTLWGGYYSGGYYPSKNSMICPAQNKENQINTPVFRMLGIDPIYGYETKDEERRLTGCYTMEPVWPCGHTQDVMEWYFRSYYENPSLALSHATTGQENSFGWEGIEKGYIIQIKLMEEYQKAGKLRVETLGETGRAFKKAFPITPASVLSAFDDWSDNGIQSVWYSCASYRANLFFKNGKLYFRDVQKYDESVNELYLDKPCVDWEAFYFNQPIVDYLLWSDGDQKAQIAFADAVEKIEFSREISEEEAEIKVYFADGHTGFVRFDSKRIEFDACGKLTWCIGKSDAIREIKGDTVTLSYHDSEYSIKLSADIERNGADVVLSPIDGKSEIKIVI